MSEAPVRIRLEKSARVLHLEWPDGKTSRFPLDFLRARCPSAGERTSRDSDSDPNPLAVLSRVPSSEVTDLRLVGNYALAFTWGDGHSAGIYSWTYLRQLAEEL